MIEPIRIGLVDDHPAIHAGIKAIIESDPGQPPISYAGGAASAAEAIDLLRNQPIDVLLVDIALPGRNGIELIRDLHTRQHMPRALVLTMHLSAAYILEAIQAGAAGYIVKSSAGEELVAAIRAVHAGEYRFDPRSLAELCKRLATLPTDTFHSGDRAYASLTDREREIFSLLASNHSVKEIAATCQLSAKTVENHKTAILRKTGTGSLVKLVEYAERIGIRKPPASPY